MSEPGDPVPVLAARHLWHFPSRHEPSAELRAAAAGHGIGDVVLGLLAARGVRTAGDLGAFLSEPPAGLHDPMLLPDAGVLLARLERARREGERVMVFGDFDADGLTGLAILVRALRVLGVPVEPYVPSRIDEGHGVSRAAVDRATERGIGVIVTVDTGSTSVPEIADARARGIDVVVTDHHRLPPELPPAVAIVNPHRVDSTYPDRRLSGAGIAFKVAHLLLAAAGAPDAEWRGLADLATIGTVADLAPVLGENRAIARLGLELLRTAPRPGLAALLARAGIARSTVDLETVSFAIAPRLNAAGRIGDAADAASLLLTDDPAEAEALAASLDGVNGTRRELTRSAVAEARARLGLGAAVRGAAGPDGGGDRPEDAAAGGEPLALAATSAGDVGPIVVRGPWPIGIVGLVASRLVEETGRPAVVGAEVGEVVRASCRSTPELDLAAALERCADLFVRHGGHPGAAGFEIEASRWEDFAERFALVAAALGTPTEGAPGVASHGGDRRRRLAIDLALQPAAVDYALVRDLAQLEPVGPGNPPVLVAIAGLTVVRVRPTNGGHTQLTLRRRVDVLDAIAFNRDDLAGAVAEGMRVDVVARLASRRFGGFESLQLEVRDIASAGSDAALVEALAGSTRGAHGALDGGLGGDAPVIVG